MNKWYLFAMVIVGLAGATFVSYRINTRRRSAEHIMYYRGDRLVTEINPARSYLQFLYQCFLGRITRVLLSCRLVARLAGIYKDSALSRHEIEPFIKTYDIAMHEYQIPEAGYGSFNEFFIRAFRPGVRQINNNPLLITSPADAKVYIIPNITTESVFFVKHQPFNLEQFLGSVSLAQEYAHGLLMIFRLAPYDYHRFHFPVDCVPSAPRVINGCLESVNPTAFKAGIQPLITNQRELILLKTERFDTIAMIPVGAMMVGKIVQTYTPNLAYKKGAETGYFAFGGSTVVLLFKPGVIDPIDTFIRHSLQGLETAVKMGEAINQ